MGSANNPTLIAFFKLPERLLDRTHTALAKDRGTGRSARSTEKPEVAKTMEEIEALALQLLPEERALLANNLLESLEGNVSAEVREAWNREVYERISAYERGECASLPAAEVIAEARRRLE